MARFELVFKRSVAKDLRAIPGQDVRRILDRIERLAEDPRGEGAIRLSGQVRYRVRQGDYRIIYQINETQLMVVGVKIAHRARVYKRPH